MTTPMPSNPKPSAPPKGPVIRSGSGGSGRAMVVVGLAVGATLGGFYMNLRRRQAKKEERGAVPNHERLMLTTYTDEDAGHLPPSRTMEPREKTLPAPSKEHNSGHSTIAESKKAPGDGESGRMEQPTPQRAHADGSAVYTKAPDYVKGYKKEKPTEMK